MKLESSWKQLVETQTKLSDSHLQNFKVADNDSTHGIKLSLRISKSNFSSKKRMDLQPF